MAFDFGNVSKLLDDSNTFLQLMSNQCERALNTLVNMHSLPLRLIEPREVLKSSYDVHDPIGSDLIVAAHFGHDVE